MLTTNGGLLFAFQDGHYVVKFIAETIACEIIGVK